MVGFPFPTNTVSSVCLCVMEMLQKGLSVLSKCKNVNNLNHIFNFRHSVLFNAKYVLTLCEFRNGILKYKNTLD